MVEKDFIVSYEDSAKAWTVQWKWAAGEEPGHLFNGIAEYHVPATARGEYESELEKWINKGWLLPYNEKEFGKPKGLIPLMAVVQKNKRKSAASVRLQRTEHSYGDAHSRRGRVC